MTVVGGEKRYAWRHSLKTLHDAYVAARTETNATAALRSDVDATCRYCGKYWCKWPGSKLDGHAQCVVTPAFKQLACSIYRDPTITTRDMANALGVTEAVIRSWCAPMRGGR